MRLTSRRAAYRASSPVHFCWLCCFEHIASTPCRIRTMLHSAFHVASSFSQNCIKPCILCNPSQACHMLHCMCAFALRLCLRVCCCCVVAPCLLPSCGVFARPLAQQMVMPAPMLSQQRMAAAAQQQTAAAAQQQMAAAAQQQMRAGLMSGSQQLMPESALSQQQMMPAPQQRVAPQVQRLPGAVPPPATVVCQRQVTTPQPVPPQQRFAAQQQQQLTAQQHFAAQQRMHAGYRSGPQVLMLPFMPPGHGMPMGPMMPIANFHGMQVGSTWQAHMLIAYMRLCVAVVHKHEMSQRWHHVQHTKALTHGLSS